MQITDDEGPAVLTVNVAGKLKYVCQQCMRAYSYMNGAIEHVKRAHMGVIEKYACTTCSKVFTWKAGYIKHCKTFGH